MLSIKKFLYEAAFKNSLLALLICWAAPVFSEQFNFVDVNAHPLGFYDEQHEVKGVAIDIFNQVMGNLGHRVNFELLPGNRVIYLLKEGKAHGVPFIRKTESRQQFLDYSTEIIISENIYIYVNKGKKFSFNGDFDFFKNKKIAVVLGDTHGEAFNNIMDSLDVIETSSISSSFKMLGKKRVDIVLSTSIRASREIKNQAHHEFTKLPTPMETVPLYVAFSKKRNLGHLKAQFDKELRKLKQAGKVKSIIESWH